MTDAERPTEVLDLLGLRCPLPVLRTRKRLEAMAPGDAVTVVTDDPLSTVDIPNFVREAGDSILTHERLARGVRFVIRRGER